MGAWLKAAWGCLSFGWRRIRGTSKYVPNIARVIVFDLHAVLPLTMTCWQQFMIFNNHPLSLWRSGRGEEVCALYAPNQIWIFMKYLNGTVLSLYEFIFNKWKINPLFVAEELPYNPLQRNVFNIFNTTEKQKSDVIYCFSIMWKRTGICRSRGIT